jgi:hypothetical protein
MSAIDALLEPELLEITFAGIVTWEYASSHRCLEKEACGVSETAGS